MTKVRVAIIGMGYWGPKIARVLHLDTNYELVAAVDLKKNFAETQLAQLGISTVPVITNYKELLKFRPELVVVAVPPQYHIEISNFFISNQINVLVEKPFGLSQPEREETLKLAAQNGVRVFVDHTYLFSPEFEVVKTVVKNGEIGPIKFYTSSRVNLGLLQESTNVVEDLMIHDLAILDAIKEDVPHRVYCVGSITKPALQIGTAFANLVYKDGFIANISVSWHSPVKIRQINLVGQSGAITWNDTSGSDKIKIYSSRIEKSFSQEDFRISYHLGDGRIPRVGTLEPLKNQFQKVFESLSTNSGLKSDAPNGEFHILRTGKTLEALVKSLELNEPVYVE